MITSLFTGSKTHLHFQPLYLSFFQRIIITRIMFHAHVDLNSCCLSIIQMTSIVTTVSLIFILKKEQPLFSKKALHSLIHNSDSKYGRPFAIFIQALIILSLITFSLETLPNISETHLHYLRMIEVGVVIVFTIEYLLRIYVAEKRLSYIFSFYGLIDLMAILPFYIASGVDLRSVRLFRLLRLIRILKLFKYNRAMQRFQRAFFLVKEEMVLFGFIALVTLFLSSVGIYYFEHSAQPEQFKSIFHSLWWALITLTTVGYGDMFPITAGGKIFTFLVLIVGLGIVAVPTGLIATALSQTRSEEIENTEETKKPK